MKVAIVGAGNIGGNIARRLALAGHELTVTFSRDPASLRALARRSERARAILPTPSPARRWLWCRCRGA